MKAGFKATSIRFAEVRKEEKKKEGEETQTSIHGPKAKLPHRFKACSLPGLSRIGARGARL
jgi:hypothetical protein